MIQTTVRTFIACAACLFLFSFSMAQQKQVPFKEQNTDSKTTGKPFRIYTTGNRITVQSKINIRKLMLWTATGDRVVEDKNLNCANYSYTVTIRKRTFFLMLELADGKRYTEKIAVQ